LSAIGRHGERAVASRPVGKEEKFVGLRCFFLAACEHHCRLPAMMYLTLEKGEARPMQPFSGEYRRRRGQAQRPA